MFRLAAYPTWNDPCAKTDGAQTQATRKAMRNAVRLLQLQTSLFNCSIQSLSWVRPGLALPIRIFTPTEYLFGDHLASGYK